MVGFMDRMMRYLGIVATQGELAWQMGKGFYLIVSIYSHFLRKTETEAGVVGPFHFYWDEKLLEEKFGRYSSTRNYDGSKVGMLNIGFRGESGGTLVD